MEIILLPQVGYNANSYLIIEKDEAAVVDPATDASAVLEQCKKRGAVLRHVLLTHVHYDHAACAAQLQKSGAKVYLHADDVPLISNGGHLAQLFGESMTCFVPDTVVHDGDILRLCGLNVRVLHTPGHTPGSVCYILGDTVFSGDTLFCLSVGRTDFPGGSAAALSGSIARLYKEAGGKKVLPGHDRPTTIDYEKENNPYA